MEIQGETVLVTGASSGIGSAIAKAIAQAGAAVVLLIARRRNWRIRRQGPHLSSGNPDQVTVIAQRTQGEAGVPDIIINNAGSTGRDQVMMASVFR